MIEYKGVTYFITEEPPLKPLQVSSFPEARKKVEKIIDENLHKSK